jgi:phage gpG-like protein
MGGMKFDHKAQRRVSTRIRKMGDRAQDVTPVWPRVGSYLAREVRRQFSTKGKHFGTPWKPLARSTRKQKSKLGYPRNPLLRSGALRRSLIGRPMAVEIYRRTNATFGSDLPTADWQQHGTRRRGRRHIPPRVMLKVTPQQSREVAKMMKKYIVGRGGGVR